tara:strand:- start:164 stop:4312 length:4149 start_codon:yes stop_codon:yes gene_type:complete
MRQKELGIHIHEEWKGMAQPVGLVVEPVVLDRLGIFPEKNIKVVTDLQMRLEALFENHKKGDDIFSAVGNFKDFCKEVLNWQDRDLLRPEELFLDNEQIDISVLLEDFGEILKPDWVVPEIDNSGEKKVQILVKELEIGMPFDQIVKNTDNKKKWEASPQQRLERLLKETENPIGILWNGISLRLIYAPRGESSGHITFPLEPMISVDGRPMIEATEMLLGPDRLFEGGAGHLKLRSIMEQSRREQNEVSTRLSEQVLEALWILVKGFDEAERKANFSGETVLEDLPNKDPSHIYGGLVTILLRLVFLLYSEDEELMPTDIIYVQNYSVSGLAAKLREDRIHFQNSMDSRYGAWSSLLSLFRLVYDGGGSYESYLPARHGELFDPDEFPFLEGRSKSSVYEVGTLKSIPQISDDVVERVLSKLIILDGQLLSYRSLDVEQIGSVYESIMGFTVEQAKNLSVGISYRPPKQKITITYVVNAEEFLRTPTHGREKWLKDQAGVDLRISKKVLLSMNKAQNISELCQALENKLSSHTPRGLVAGSLILQPTPERRKSGSHYTPRELSEPLVEKAFNPWLERYSYQPSAKNILDLKVCDPAMGSGAFLVASCRFLGGLLVEAWSREGFPEEFDETFDKDNYARRLIAQNCLYGVDKNPFAVNLSKLSLWLVTLSKNLPFTFLDHALKCGDSLVGFSIKEINDASKEIQITTSSFYKKEFKEIGVERIKTFNKDSRNDQNYDFKKQELIRQFNASEELRKAGDLMVAAFFNATKNADRLSKRDIYLSLLNENSNNELIKEKRETLSHRSNKVIPFHWEIEFPEVFESNNKGFDVIIGNPPFVASTHIHGFLGPKFRDWIDNRKENIKGRAVDLCAHFFRHSFDLLKNSGALSFIATNTICQGDTREAGLHWICKNGGIIYWKNKRSPWPGAASVTISKVAIYKVSKDNWIPSMELGPSNSYLMKGKEFDNPKSIDKCKNIAFMGHIVLGDGFTFTKNCKGNSNDIDTAIELLKNDIYRECIHPFSGGKEILSKADSSPDRYVICFGNKSLSEIKEKYPDLYVITKAKVFPDRQKIGGYSVAEKRKENWWKFGTYASSLQTKLGELDKCLVIPIVASNLVCEIMPSNIIFSHSSIIFCDDSWKLFGILQSSLHLEWTIFRGSTMGDGLRYTPTDCFETLVLPWDVPLEWFNDSHSHNYNQYLNDFSLAAKNYHSLRSSIKKVRNIGLTEIYNRFHDPSEQSDDILQLRNLHFKCEKFLLKLYGWEDLVISYGFDLDYLDYPEDITFPIDLKDKIDLGDMYFNESKEANIFVNRMQEFGVIKASQKLSWRYRWPKDIRDEIISRLLELNNRIFIYQKNEGVKYKKAGYKSKDRQNLRNNLDQIQIGLDI